MQPGVANSARALYKNAYTALHYRLRTFAGGRWNDHCRPTDIGFMMTNLCNAKCVHCDIWKNRGKEDLPGLDDYKRVSSDLRSWLGPVHVFLSGGEALLRPYTPEVLAHGASVGLLMEVLTHGYWDDQSRIERVAVANPWRVTVSVDAASATHDKVRGREKFWEKTHTTIQTLLRLRKEKRLGFLIRLKTVVMSHNLEEVAGVARFASQHERMDVFYQAIEQNYNTPEDPRWFDRSENWPRNTERAVEVVNELIGLKRQGLPVGNGYHQLDAMIPYFRNPDASRISIQSHAAHEHKAICAALSSIQIQPNGDVLTCYGMPPVGNIRTTPIRTIWENRPQWWKEGCCLHQRCTPAEKQTLSLIELAGR
jgi:MoaA/NifB/PqqE/SkfB family radical SAM enzyme